MIYVNIELETLFNRAVYKDEKGYIRATEWLKRNVTDERYSHESHYQSGNLSYILI